MSGYSENDKREFFAIGMAYVGSAVVSYVTMSLECTLPYTLLISAFTIVLVWAAYHCVWMLCDEYQWSLPEDCTISLGFAGSVAGNLITAIIMCLLYVIIRVFVWIVALLIPQIYVVADSFALVVLARILWFLFMLGGVFWGVRVTGDCFPGEKIRLFHKSVSLPRGFGKRQA